MVATAMPIKVGRIKLRLRPSPFVKPDAFSQTLHLENGSISILARRGDLAVSARLWVDSAAGVRPHTSSAAVVFVELNASAPVAASVALDLWRGVGVRNATVNFTGSCYSTCTKWQLIDGDTIASRASLRRGEAAAWAVRNTRSFYRRTLDDHMLGALANSTIDPLLHRTSGALVTLEPQDDGSKQQQQQRQRRWRWRRQREQQRRQPSQMGAFRVHAHLASSTLVVLLVLLLARRDALERRQHTRGLCAALASRVWRRPHGGAISGGARG